MKIHICLLIIQILVACSSSQKPQCESPLQGAWVLSKVEYPIGGIETFPIQDMRPLRIYEGDSVMLQCGLTQTASGIVIHQPYLRSGITLIDKGGGDYLYLEDREPRPLDVVDDTTVTIQRNGILFTWHRADEIAQEWGEEISRIIIDNSQDGEGYGVQRFVLSAKERTQSNIIHVLIFSTIACLFLILLIAHVAVSNRKESVRLQLLLQQIREEHDERPQAIRHAIECVENSFFSSDEYLALQRRIATGKRLKEEDWSEIEEHLKKVYPGFVSQLHSIYPMSELEFQTCLLIKLRIAPTDIAGVLSREASTISTVRSRLYRKVFGRKGSTREWDDFILSIGT